MTTPSHNAHLDRAIPVNANGEACYPGNGVHEVLPESRPGGPPRPKPAHIRDGDVENIPPAIREKRAWIGWQWEWKEETDKRKSKWDKPPVDPATRRHIDKTDERHWMSFDKARAAALAVGLDGVGISLGPPGNRVGVVGIDLDKCIDDRGGDCRMGTQDRQGFQLLH